MLLFLKVFNIIRYVRLRKTSRDDGRKHDKDKKVIKKSGKQPEKGCFSFCVNQGKVEEKSGKARKENEETHNKVATEPRVCGKRKRRKKDAKKC